MCHYVDLQMTQCELGIGPFDDAYILAAERSRAWLFVLNELDLNCTSLECVLKRVVLTPTAHTCGAR